MAEHRWRWTGEPREFPYHDLRDGNGDRIVLVGTGDVVVTDSLAFGDDHPDLAVRLDKPRRTSKRDESATAAAELEPDVEPDGSAANVEGD